MADAQTVQSWTQRNEFLLRRLHSLSGVIPVGAFLIEHLFTNSLAFGADGIERFDEAVHSIHHLPYLLVLEILFIFLPLAFHAIYGIVIARTGQSNLQRYGWGDNWRYTLQRVSGWIAFFYIILHVVHFRFAWIVGGPEYVGTPVPFSQMQQGFQQVLPQWLWLAIYAVGLVASVYHFVNGLTTFCITWGITVGDKSRKRVWIGCSGLGVILTVWGLLSLWAIATQTPQSGGPENVVEGGASPAVVHESS